MIVFAHLLNDRSGSTRVLKSIMSGRAHGSNLLFVGGGRGGLLDDANGAIRPYWYYRSSNRIVTLLAYVTGQIILFLSLCSDRRISKTALIYVNTLMPFGAALYGWVTGRCVIYHLHELSIKPRLLRILLVSIARLTATRLIYVSQAHRDLLPIDDARAVVIHNAVDYGLITAAADSVTPTDGPLAVLMLSYNRPYKGVSEFITLAERLVNHQDISFHLVLSDGLAEIEAEAIPANLTLYPASSEPELFYAKAGLVVNLSRTDLCVETFGLTLIEAMAFGVPVIGPPVGGPAEIIHDGFEGFLIDSRDQDALVDAVHRLVRDPELRLRMSKAARRRAKDFTASRFQSSVADTIAYARGALR